MKKALLAITLGVTLGSAALLAHHGGNLYDTRKATEVQGPINKFEWGTPHNQIYFDVKLPNGEVREDVAVGCAGVADDDRAGMGVDGGHADLLTRRVFDEVNDRNVRPSAQMTFRRVRCKVR